MKLNDLLIEKEIKEQPLKEMAYPANFNLQEFSKLPSFKARKQYCDERLPKLGQGTSRIAYKVDNEKALKLAFNKKGIAQNEHEADWGRNNYGVFGEIFDADTDNYTWIEMELARTPKKQDFKRLLGITFEETCDLIKYCYEQYSQYSQYRNNRFQLHYSTMVEDLYEKLVAQEESDFFVSFQRYVYDYQPYSVMDWLRISNWGIVNRNGQEHLVIIDDGLDEDVLNKYYSRRR